MLGLSKKANRADALNHDDCMFCSASSWSGSCRYAEGFRRRAILIPWVLLETASVPGNGGELSLVRRGAEFSIRLKGNELMNSRLGGSETALATLACAKLATRKNPRVLIGGLGMGFTLRGTLTALGPTAQVTVAELVPAVLTWSRGLMAPVFGDVLDDPRVCIREADVGQLIRSSTSTFDAILIDVDNGPEGLTRAANDALYDLEGLRAARGALSSGGILAVWSAGSDAAFVKRLLKTGFHVDEVRVPARKSQTGAKHVIWIAIAPTF
jgi:spermidine synthase